MIYQQDNFQTPDWTCEYMVNFIPKNSKKILEPTPGKGNLVRAIKKNIHCHVYAPNKLEDIPDGTRYDCVVMNPPFTPMKKGYQILYKMMEMSDMIIALMPWLTIINSVKRTIDISSYGIVSITHLPRSVFPGSRVQTCVLVMQKGFKDNTVIKFLTRKYYSEYNCCSNCEETLDSQTKCIRPQ